MSKKIWMIISFTMAWAHIAHAEALLTLNNGQATPGIVTAWSGSGKKIELSLKAGQDAQKIADAIQSNIDGVSVKVSGGKVLVVGKTQTELLPLLAEVQADEDELGMLAAASNLGMESDSGSSLRAKKTADMQKLLKDTADTALGRVSKIEGGNFPHAKISFRIDRAPTGPLGQKIRKGQFITVVPVLKQTNGQIDWQDANTQQNVGAWYFEVKDRIQVKLGQALGANTFEAVLISR